MTEPSERAAKSSDGAGINSPPASLSGLSADQQLVAWVSCVILYGLEQDDRSANVSAQLPLNFDDGDACKTLDDLCDGRLLVAFAMSLAPDLASGRVGAAVFAKLSFFLKFCRKLDVPERDLFNAADVWPKPPKKPGALVRCLLGVADTIASSPEYSQVPALEVSAACREAALAAGRGDGGPERRMDPGDGSVYTLEELKQACAEKYTVPEILQYWGSSCKPVKDAGKKSANQSRNDIAARMRAAVEAQLRVRKSIRQDEPAAVLSTRQPGDQGHAAETQIVAQQLSVAKPAGEASEQPAAVACDQGNAAGTPPAIEQPSVAKPAAPATEQPAAVASTGHDTDTSNAAETQPVVQQAQAAKQAVATGEQSAELVSKGQATDQGNAAQCQPARQQPSVTKPAVPASEQPAAAGSTEHAADQKNEAECQPVGQQPSAATPAGTASEQQAAVATDQGKETETQPAIQQPPEAKPAVTASVRPATVVPTGHTVDKRDAAKAQPASQQPSVEKPITPAREPLANTGDGGPERRMNPEDGFVYTLEELKEACADTFSLSQILEYWGSTCRPVANACPGSAAKTEPVLQQPPVAKETVPAAGQPASVASTGRATELGNAANTQKVVQQPSVATPAGTASEQRVTAEAAVDKCTNMKDTAQTQPVASQPPPTGKPVCPAGQKSGALEPCVDSDSQSGVVQQPPLAKPAAPASTKQVEPERSVDTSTDDSAVPQPSPSAAKQAVPASTERCATDTSVENTPNASVDPQLPDAKAPQNVGGKPAAEAKQDVAAPVPRANETQGAVDFQRGMPTELVSTGDSLEKTHAVETDQVCSKPQPTAEPPALPRPSVVAPKAVGDENAHIGAAAEPSAAKPDGPASEKPVAPQASVKNGNDAHASAQSPTFGPTVSASPELVPPQATANSNTDASVVTQPSAAKPDVSASPKPVAPQTSADNSTDASDVAQPSAAKPSVLASTKPVAPQASVDNDADIGTVAQPAAAKPTEPVESITLDGAKANADAEQSVSSPQAHSTHAKEQEAKQELQIEAAVKDSSGPKTQGKDGKGKAKGKGMAKGKQEDSQKGTEQAKEQTPYEEKDAVKEQKAQQELQIEAAVKENTQGKEGKGKAKGKGMAKGKRNEIEKGAEQAGELQPYEEKHVADQREAKQEVQIDGAVKENQQGKDVKGKAKGKGIAKGSQKAMEQESEQAEEQKHDCKKDLAKEQEAKQKLPSDGAMEESSDSKTGSADSEGKAKGKGITKGKAHEGAKGNEQARGQNQHDGKDGAKGQGIEEVEKKNAQADAIITKHAAGGASHAEAEVSVESLRKEWGGDGNLIVCIVGGSKFSKDASAQLVKAFAGKADKIAPKVRFVTSGMAGVQQTFAEHCSSGAQVWNLVASGESSRFSKGKDLHVGGDTRRKKEIYLQVGDVYITVEGGPGLAQEARSVAERGAKVLPLIRTGGASAGTFGFPEACLQSPDAALQAEWQLIRDGDASVEDSAEAALRIVACWAGISVPAPAPADAVAPESTVPAESAKEPASPPNADKDQKQDTKTDATKMIEPKSDEAKPSELKAEGARLSESRAEDAKPQEQKADATMPQEPKAQEAKPSESKADNGKPQSKADVAKAEEATAKKAVEPKADVTKPPEQKAGSGRPQEPKAEQSKSQGEKADVEKQQEHKADEAKLPVQEVGVGKPQEPKADTARQEMPKTTAPKSDDPKPPEGKLQETKPAEAKPSPVTSSAAKAQEIEGDQKPAVKEMHRVRAEMGEKSSLVCLLSGTSVLSADSEQLVKQIAEKCAAGVGSHVIFFTCGTTGVQQTFAEHCGDGSQLRHLMPEGQKSNFKHGKDVHAGANLGQRKEIFGLLGDIYLTIEGGLPVAQVAKAAALRGVPVIPLIRSGGASSGKFDFPAQALKPPAIGSCAKHWPLLEDKDAPAGDSAAAVVSILKELTASKASAAAAREEIAPSSTEEHLKPSKRQMWLSRTTTLEVAEPHPDRKDGDYHVVVSPPDMDTAEAAAFSMADEVARVRRKILGRRRGAMVCLLGGEKLGEKYGELVKTLATTLVTVLNPSVRFAICGDLGAQRAFAEHCGDPCRVWHVLPVGQHSDANHVQVGSDQEQRNEVFAQLGDVYVTVEGGAETSQIARAVLARGVPLVPIARTGGASAGLFDFPPEALDCPPHVRRDLWATLADGVASEDASAVAATSIIAGLVDAREMGEQNPGSMLTLQAFCNPDDASYRGGVRSKAAGEGDGSTYPYEPSARALAFAYRGELPELSGVLWKRSPKSFIRWRAFDQRFFVLRDRHLLWWKSQEDAQSSDACQPGGGRLCKGDLDLFATNCVLEVMADSDTGFALRPLDEDQGWSARKDPSRVFIFDAADSNHTRQEWMDAIYAHTRCIRRKRTPFEKLCEYDDLVFFPFDCDDNYFEARTVAAYSCGRLEAPRRTWWFGLKGAES